MQRPRQVVVCEHVHELDQACMMLIDRLNAMDAEFMRVLGPGMYMSPEILVKKELCSVCQQDNKGCDHIPGHLYAGVRCFGIVQDSDLKSISMVMNPRDRRCRIWPWRYKSGTRFESVVATMFRLETSLTSRNSVHSMEAELPKWVTPT